jgi:hypothetical protein
MASIFRPTTADDLDDILRLFRDAFHPPENAQILDRTLLLWKYYAERPDFDGARSFGLEKEGRLVAHGCVWPFELLRASEPLRGVHLIDWAADATSAGAGVTLLRRLLAQTGFVCSFGGSSDTRAILPKVGFRPLNEIRTYARPLRPLKQALTHQYRNCKLPVRLARNLFWRTVPRLLWPAGWSAIPTSPRDIDPALFPTAVDGRLPCARSTDVLEYLSQCPSVPFTWYTIAKNGRPRGYFSLAVAHGQSRVADLWMTTQSVDDYAAAHTLAALVSLRDTSAAEIIATSCWDGCSQALSASGYRFVSATPIMVSGAATKELGDAPIDFHMVDCDFAFLHEGRVSYAT